MPTLWVQRLARNGLTIRLTEEQANAIARQSAAGATGELRIRTVPIISERFTTTASSEFIIKNPDCAVELRVGLVHELCAILERDQVDVVIGPHSIAEGVAGVSFQDLVDDRIRILCRAEHFLTGSGQPTMDALRQSVWLRHSRDSQLRQQTEAALHEMGIEDFHVGLETDSVARVFEIVATTDLVSTMPMISALPYLEDQLVFLLVDHPSFSRSIGVIRPSGVAHNQNVENFLSGLRRSIGTPARS